MENWFGTSTTFVCPPALGYTIKSVQADVSDPSTTDVSIILSGHLGTYYSVSAVSPIVADLVFQMDENITITATGTSLNGALINYIKRGDQLMYRANSVDKRHSYLPGKWKVPASGYRDRTGRNYV